jgi:CRP-like cAMP-binding protein
MARPENNRLLAALPPEVLSRIQPALRPITLTPRQVLHHANTPIDAVYFVTAGRLSLVLPLGDGAQAEAGIVGREGVAGLPAIAGQNAFAEAMVQGAGHAFRMEAPAFRRAFDDEPAFRQILLRYSDAMQAQVMQTAACNGQHSLEQRLARWLLMARDRGDSDDLDLTQEFLAMMLCVYRPSVTTTVGALQRAGIIQAGRGRVTVLDRQALERTSCDCYISVKRRFDEVLGPPES